MDDKKKEGSTSYGTIDGSPAILLGGQEGVFGIVDNGDHITIYSGDDGSWNQIGRYHKYWVEGIIACLRRSLNG